MVDVYAVLSGSGNGEFFATMLRDSFLPPPTKHPLAIELAETSNAYHAESRVILPILKADQEMSTYAAQLARLCQEIREVVVQRKSGDRSQVSSLNTKFLHCKQQVDGLQKQLSRVWNSTVPAQFLSGFRHDHLPQRIRGIFERVCIIRLTSNEL